MKELTFTEVLKDLKSKSGLSAKKFALKMGVNENTFKGWMKGTLPVMHSRSGILRRATAVMKSQAVPIGDIELPKPESIKMLSEETEAAISRDRPDIPHYLLIDALNQHCPPSVSIKILDSIRGDMGW